MPQEMDVIKKIISKIIKVPVEKISDSDDLIEKHGMDSLARVEIVTELEKEFDILIDDQESLGLTTVSKFVELIIRKQTSNA